MKNMEDLISKHAQQAIEEKVFPGCVVGIVRKNGERLILPFGRFTYDPNANIVREDTIYDVASITKSIPVACLALKFIEQKKLNTTDKLIKYLPEFNNSDRENVLIKHLLTYTLDGYTPSSLKKKTTDELLKTLLTHDFNNPPGKVFKYTNISAALLGLVVEKISGNTIDNLADEYFFKPLKMCRSTFYPEKLPLEEIVPTEIDDWRGEVRGIVHDESAYICKKEGKIVGHAGLFSTAGDILTFLEMLLNGGIYDGRKYFSENTIRQMETNQIEDMDDYTGLGWELNQPRFMGKFCGPYTFGKTGFTGTLCVVDRGKEIGYVILSNRIYPMRPKNSSAINAFRGAIGGIILSRHSDAETSASFGKIR